jgi:transmembrane sensor
VEIDFAGNSRAKIILKPSEKVVIAANPAMILNPATTLNSNTRNNRRDTLAATGLPAFTRSVIVPDKTDGTFAETSWVDNRLVFRNESLAGLAGRLERWYDIKICFDSDRYQQENVTGAFKDARLEDVMHALQLTTGLHYRIAADTVRIW